MHGKNSDDRTTPPGRPAFLTVQSDGVTLAVKLQPRASANEILPHNPSTTELRVRVMAPPVDSAANEALVRLLADRLECSRGAVQLIRGHASHRKVLKLHGLSAEDVLAKLMKK